jgi:hypothetical protein
MHVFEFSDLPIRPLRFRGESLLGYAYRLCEANGHVVPTGVRRALSSLYRSRDFETRRIAAHVVAKLVGPVAEEDWPVWQEHRGWRCQSASRMRVCPACLREVGFHLALWELPLVHACLDHRTVLRDSCDCGKLFRWQALEEDWRCSCGISLRYLVAHQADKGSITLSRAVCRAAHNKTSSPERDNWNLDFEDRSLSLDDVYARAEFLHRLDVRYVLGRRERDTAPRSPGASVGRFFQSWHKNFSEYVETWLVSFFDTKGKSTPVVLLPAQSSVTRLFKTVEKPETFQGAAKDCSVDVMRIMRKYLVPTRWPSVVLIRSDVEREVLKVWLNIFSSLVEGARSAIQDVDRARKNIPKAQTNQQRKELRLLLVSLINAILRGDMPHDYLKATCAWPALPDFAGGTGEEWLAHVIAPLHDMSLRQLRNLRECFEPFSGNEE